MLTKIKLFTTDGIPTEEDIKDALLYAKAHNCWVRIMYEAFNYQHEWLIDPQKSFEEIWANRTRVYGL